MTLDDFLKRGTMTAADLARESKLSAVSISRILFGEQKPSHDAIKAIVAATKGKVTADDLVFGQPRDASEKRQRAAA